MIWIILLKTTQKIVLKARNINVKCIIGCYTERLILITELMKKKLLSNFACMLTMLFVLVVQTTGSLYGQNALASSKRDMVLWYTQPGLQWLEGLPIGNGYMGGMVFGRVNNERIALNESTFWSGRPNDYTNPEAYKYFDTIRNLVFDGKYKEAEKAINEHFYGIPKNQQAYQPLGDLLLNFKNSDNVKDYYRELDMETGVVKVTYKDGDAEFTREIFMSYPDRVMVIRLTCNKPGKINFEAKLKSPLSRKPCCIIRKACYEWNLERPVTEKCT